MIRLLTRRRWPPERQLRVRNELLGPHRPLLLLDFRWHDHTASDRTRDLFFRLRFVSRELGFLCCYQ